MELKVLLFGILRDITNMSEDSFSVDGPITLAAFNSLLKQKYPVLTTYVYSIAVNEAYQNANFNLSDGDTIALIPPVSGG